MNNDQDFPAELLQKLDALKLELEDGDITEKGYEKKRANLLDRHTQDKRQQEQDALAELGPEPSAADVIDFLDYLPSPTHSPPKPQTGAQLMEQHHASSSSSSSSSSSTIAPRTSSIQASTPAPQHHYPQQQQHYQQASPQLQHQQQQQQQQAYYQQQGYSAADYPGQYYPTMNSPRPNRPAYAARPLPQANYSPQYYARPYQQPHPQQRPMQYHPQQQQQQPYSSSRPMYRTATTHHPPAPQRASAAPAGYYRSAPPMASQAYPVHGRSPTMDHRVPYGYAPNNGGISRSATQHSSGTRYA
ncbi:hypothetical protein DM01DRAFT_1336238 [Hesseltinella vesiculosa]|uniref:DMAP1-binding domain-containing protein n=1 Tax=Hesseltinella vesiculosa TaxID=101127 RepID=A0A1X2GGA1_9FUNG|nr:hypothetical protein DM01DRAFT_1336238 [Hesseltinella vesiculosa]